jgi:hypothetical protein
MIRNYALALLLIGFVAFSCQKEADDDNGGGNKTKMDLITSAAWKYDTAAIDVDGNGSTEQALPPGTILSCDRDNTITLKKDGTGTVDEGGSKCNTSDPQQTAITWQFKDNETVINIPNEIFGVSGDVKILELTETKLRITKKVDITDPIPISVWVVVTLKH